MDPAAIRIRVVGEAIPSPFRKRMLLFPYPPQFRQSTFLLRSSRGKIQSEVEDALFRGVGWWLWTGMVRNSERGWYDLCVRYLFFLIFIGNEEGAVTNTTIFLLVIEDMCLVLFSE